MVREGYIGWPIGSFRAQWDLKGSPGMADKVEEAMRTFEAYCESRVPEEVREEIRIECTRRGKSITIVERLRPGTRI